jgi:hypothetical protein
MRRVFLAYVGDPAWLEGPARIEQLNEDPRAHLLVADHLLLHRAEEVGGRTCDTRPHRRELER